MNKEKRGEILSRLRDANPHPTTELRFETPFELLIAVMIKSSYRCSASVAMAKSAVPFATPSAICVGDS